MGCKVELPDGSWQNTDDLNGLELEAIEKATGTPWILINPLRDLSAYRAIVAAFALRAPDVTNQEVIDWFNGRTALQLNAGIEVVVEDDLPGSFEDGIPKAGDGPTTGSSVSSPDPLSDGPPT